MNANALSDDSGEEDNGRHVRMLQGITGMPSEAFEENKKLTMKDAIIPELYPESEYNPSRDVVDGDGRVSIEDLLNPLRENPDYGKLRKRMQQIEKNAKTIYAPLPKADQVKVERKAAYEISKKDVTKWQHIIQRNREAPTIFFGENVDLGFSTVGAIASEFEPRTEFERKMAALVHDEKVMEAHKKDGSRLLEMNKKSNLNLFSKLKVSIEDEKDRQNRIAKMRSLLFRHEMKAKHVKKIKSRTYHRLLKKDRLKAESSRIQMDPEAAKEYAMKQERQRAEGLQATGKSKEKTMKVLEEEDEVPKSGLLLYLLWKKGGGGTGVLNCEERRGLEKRKEAAVEEANLALQEFEDSLKKLENADGSEDPKAASTSGRRVFGTSKAQASDVGNKKDVNSDFVLVQEDTDTHKESVFKAKNKNDKDTNIKQSPKLTGPVKQDIKDTEKELGEDSDTDGEGQMVDGILSSVSKPSYELPSQEELIRQAFAGDDVEDDFEKDKEGILNEENPEPEKPLSLPGWGQWTHIQQKKGLPSWMLKKHEDAQKKRAEALKKRKDAQLKNVIISEKLDKKHVFHKYNRVVVGFYDDGRSACKHNMQGKGEAEKLHTKVLPYPFTSKEVFEQSMRVPIGPEFNPATAIGPLNRPEVLKRAGVIIKPIEFKEVNPHEKTEQRSGDKHKSKKSKDNGGKPIKKTKVKGKS
ncbi:Small-subunit processome, Utp14 [Sesbania bispinosa]|nr:Small-subunit processome, Utp14 [Sesbania bispinosa]